MSRNASNSWTSWDSTPRSSRFPFPFTYDGDDATRSRNLEELHYDTLINHAPSLRLAKEQFGAEHLMLGSDYPPGDGSLEDAVRLVCEADLSEDERELVLGGNAVRLLEFDLQHAPDTDQSGRATLGLNLEAVVDFMCRLVALARVDNLHTTAGGDVLGELLDCQRWHASRGRRVFIRQRLVVPHDLDPLQDDVPIDSAEKRVDICRRVCAEVHLVGVFVRVQNQHRDGVDCGLGVICRELVPESGSRDPTWVQLCGNYPAWQNRARAASARALHA